MTERKKVECKWAYISPCKGRIRKVLHLVLHEVDGETVYINLCERHQQDNSDEV